MKKWFVLGLILISTTSLYCEDETQVIVQPSSSIRYPQLDEVINPRPTQIPKVEIITNNQKLPTGWFYQVVINSSLQESLIVSQIIQNAFPERKIFLRLTGTEYRCLIGPLALGEIRTTLERLKPLKVGESLLRFEEGS